jgi:hypothetical protein
VAVAPVALAAICAVFAAGHGGASNAIVVLLTVIAAILGAYSRPMALAAVRYAMFLVIVSNMAESQPDRVLILLLMTAGATWTALLTFALGAVVRRSRSDGPRAPSAAPVATRRLSRWKSVLSQASGWQFALRLGACLAIAQVVRSLWPDHHLYWMALTVVILTQRQVERLPVMTTQRAFGTALGVLAASLFLVYKPPVWGMILGIGVLAGMRPLLKVRNYLLYSAIMAPLILLLLDSSDPIRPGLLLDRLGATVAGALLVLAANAIAAGFMPRAKAP